MDYPQRVIVGLCLGAVAIGVLLGSGEDHLPVSTQAVEPADPGQLEHRELTIHVSGGVVEPGVVVVADGSIVADVIAAAGGARIGARLDLLNLSRAVVDGEHVEVPDAGSRPSGSEGATEDGLVQINRATVSELERLPGVGPVLAGRIVDYRDTVGRFETVEDLLDVSGIGEAKLASLRDFIVIP